MGSLYSHGALRKIHSQLTIAESSELSLQKKKGEFLRPTQIKKICCLIDDYDFKSIVKAFESAIPPLTFGIFTT